MSFRSEGLRIRAQGYLDTADQVEGIDPDQASRFRSYAQQLIDEAEELERQEDAKES